MLCRFSSRTLDCNVDTRAVGYGVERSDSSLTQVLRETMKRPGVRVASIKVESRTRQLSNRHTGQQRYIHPLNPMMMILTNKLLCSKCTNRPLARQVKRGDTHSLPIRGSYTTHSAVAGNLWSADCNDFHNTVITRLTSEPANEFFG